MVDEKLLDLVTKSVLDVLKAQDNYDGIKVGVSERVTSLHRKKCSWAISLPQRNVLRL